MGTLIEINDTLRITKKQGFPTKLDIEKHIKDPYKLASLSERVFEFSSKPKIRVYKVPPVRNFLVEELHGKWIYWGLCHILEVHHDYLKQETSGKYRIIYLNSPDEIKKAHELIDRNPDTNYFA